MKPMIKYIFLATFFFGIIACEPNTFRPVNYTSEQLTNQLELAFRQIKTDSFGQFFTNWNNVIKSNTVSFIHQNDTIAAVFNIYKVLYKPLDLLKLGEWEWGNDLNSECKYVVVQNKIFYSVLEANHFNDDYSWEKTKKDSIINFRPPIDLDSNKVLYLTAEYEKSINKFLGTESTTVGEGNIMNPSRPKGESEKRYNTLRQYIPILQGHWGGYWHIETHPEISVIVLDKALTKATAYFQVGYQGGEASLVRNGNIWIITKSKPTWIE